MQIFGIYMDCLFESVALYFTAMEKSYIPMIIQGSILPVHLLCCELYVNTFGFGYLGVAHASNTTNFFCLVAIYLLVKCIKDPEVKQAWVPFNMDVFVELKSFIKFAFAGLLIHCFQSWANEGIQIISGWIGTTGQAAVVIVYSILSVMMFIPMSFSYSISALVGAALGQGNIF